MIDYGKLQKSLQHLERQFENLSAAASRPELTQLDREGIAESVIQRFEACYDSLWKVLKRYMMEELGLAEVPNSPKAVLKLAGQQQLLASPVEAGLRYADARVNTSHNYSEAQAKETLALVADFITNATQLYERMSGEKWSQQ